MIGVGLFYIIYWLVTLNTSVMRTQNLPTCSSGNVYLTTGVPPVIIKHFKETHKISKTNVI